MRLLLLIINVLKTKITHNLQMVILFLFLLSGSNLFSQGTLNNGLVAYYPFTGNANDVSGNNNNPSSNNATLTADRFGVANNAYHFNGTNNAIRIPNSSSLQLSNKISMCAWVRVTGFYTGPCGGNSILMKGNDDFVTGNYG